MKMMTIENMNFFRKSSIKNLLGESGVKNLLKKVEEGE
jgi:hypothetical protein